MRLEIVDRRNFVLGASAFAAVVSLISLNGTARAQDAAMTLEEALKKVMGDAKPSDGKIVLELPEIAENGNTVPFTISVESPMIDADHVKAMHVFAPANPQVDIATFNFTPASGKAATSSRMRLAKTQEIVVIAELSNKKFLLAKRTVKVTIGGCGG